MRPVRRGKSPRTADFNDYKDAKLDLISRVSHGTSNGNHIGSYCSYCERNIHTNLAVEHILPKDGLYGKPHLRGCWDNFLLACVNCNSTKRDKQVIFSELYFPDRDNTFYAFDYRADGTICPAPNLSNAQKEIANNTLALTGLDKKIRETKDSNGKTIAIDRSSQRMQAWGIAVDSLDDYEFDTSNTRVQNSVVKLMLSEGFFSIWMTVFKNHPAMRNRFIDAISGTRESGCFDLISTEPISPHPNDDGLQCGSKI